MSITYSITTDDKALYDKLVAIATGAISSTMGAPAPVAAAPAPAPVAAPVAAPAQVAVAPAPAPAPVAAAPAAAKGEPQPGWTIEHVRHVLAGLATNPAKGPAAVQALLAKYGASQVSDLDPAKWHLFYQDAQQA